MCLKQMLAALPLISYYHCNCSSEAIVQLLGIHALLSFITDVPILFDGWYVLITLIVLQLEIFQSFTALI
jgi:hypothetical protein